MKTELVVIDFDKTLIRFDSFRNYLIIWLKYYPIQILFYIVLRKCRLFSNYRLKKKIINLVGSHPHHNKIDRNYAKYLISKINVSLIRECKNMIAAEGKILILSASPDCYISIIGSMLNISAQGSYFNPSGKFIHLHGPGKVEYILDAYPKTYYMYKYAISDSLSDQQFLDLFNNYKIL